MSHPEALTSKPDNYIKDARKNEIADNIDKKHSVSFIEDVTGDKVLLRSSNSMNLYLVKVGLLFSIYWLILSITCFIAVIKPEMIRNHHFGFRFLNFTWIYIILFCSIKLLFGIFGYYVRNFALIFFIIDCIISIPITLNIYMHFEGFVKTQYIGHGYFVVLSIWSLFAASIGFMLSALIKNRNLKYNYCLGIIICQLFSIIPLLVRTYVWKDRDITSVKFIPIFIFALLYNVYFAVDMYQVVNYRTIKYYDHEYAYCFLTTWTDFFYLFWRDICGTRQNNNPPDIIAQNDDSIDPNAKVIHIREDI